MQKITPFLWFNENAEEAMNFYTSVFKNSKIVHITRKGNSGPGATKEKEKEKQSESEEEEQGSKGSAISGIFQIEGQTFYALNGGPQFTFSPAISFFVNCETQDEIDNLWVKLTENGTEQQCGWVKDKFGISWQIIPSDLGKMLGDKDAEKSKRVMNAMLKMKKMDINSLKEAYAG